jgi:tRNA(adenine34) deaminase
LCLKIIRLLAEDMTDTAYMKLAIEEGEVALAEGEIPVGAVVVCNGVVVGRGHNQREAWSDPTAHAEVIAIREAAGKLGGWRLLGAVIYVTVEPCPMCAGAIQQARIKRLVYGIPDPKAGAVESLYNIVQDGRLNHIVEVTAGIAEEECRELMKKFFRELREKD